MSGVAADARAALRQIDAGNPVEALAILRTVLADVRPDPDHPVVDLAEAARLYAGVLAVSGEPFAALEWSDYAHVACEYFYGPADRRALHASSTYAYVLRVTGYHDESVELYHVLVERFAELFGPTGRRTLAGHADLAAALYAAGDCGLARRTLHMAYFGHRDTFGGGDREGIRMLARLGGMTRDCGHFDKAHQYFDAAKALCRQHLSGSDPLTRKVITMARAGMDEEHACGRPVAVVTPRIPAHRPPADDLPVTGTRDVDDGYGVGVHEGPEEYDATSRATFGRRGRAARQTD